MKGPGLVSTWRKRRRLEEIGGIKGTEKEKWNGLKEGGGGSERNGGQEAGDCQHKGFASQSDCKRK